MALGQFWPRGGKLTRWPARGGRWLEPHQGGQVGSGQVGEVGHVIP